MAGVGHGKAWSGTGGAGHGVPSYRLHPFPIQGIGQYISDQKLRVFAQDTLAGLAYMHSKKYIHRDLKPGNMFWTTDKFSCVLEICLICMLPAYGGGEWPGRTRAGPFGTDRACWGGPGWAGRAGPGGSGGPCWTQGPHNSESGVCIK